MQRGLKLGHPTLSHVTTVTIFVLILVCLGRGGGGGVGEISLWAK